MDFTYIVVFTAAALLYSVLIRPRWRGWALMVASVVAIYWLQPRLPIYPLDFILPTGALALTVAGWLATRKADQPVEREDKIALSVTAALVLGLSLTRYLNLDTLVWWHPTASRPPEVLPVAAALVVFAGVMVAVGRLLRRRPALALNGMIVFIIALFVAFKARPLTEAVATWLRTQTGRDVTPASVGDLEWLGFSYVAFRLIHTLRDRQTGKLPALSLRQYLTYAIFFPAVTAGPIDRAERFARDDATLPDMTGLEAGRFVEGGTRIMVGIFKKFVVADGLALLALNPVNAAQTDSTLWTWAMLYGYAFRLFFDFSGYTDIAIGIGRLFGISLLENFERPYLKSNITAFWQSWHMTLSNWARFYVFSPLSRALMKRQSRLPLLLIVFISQMATMVVIGLWHGVSLNFVVWGVWHGVGLFVHKVWSDRTRKWYRGLKDRPRTRRAVQVAGVLITFHFATLSWVWFALTDAKLAGDVFMRLLGR